MAITYTVNSDLNINWEGSNDSGPSTGKHQNTRTWSQNTEVSYGTTGESSRRVYAAQRTVSVGSGTDDIDLTALTDFWGNTLTFATVLLIFVRNTDTDSGDDLLIGGAGSANNAFSPPWNSNDDAQNHIGPNGRFVIESPDDAWTVDASNKTLRIEHSGGTGSGRTYDIVIVGTV